MKWKKSNLPIKRYRNFIMEDPILDFLDYSNSYKRDDDYENFDKELLLSNYIAKNKRTFSEKIADYFDHNFFKLETEIGTAHYIMKTSLLEKYFVNHKDYATGDNFSLFTLEYSSIKTSKTGQVLHSPREQKYYNFKNWVMKQEALKNGIRIDHSFILGRKYTKCNSFNYLAKSHGNFKMIREKAEEHLRNVSKLRIGETVFPNMKNKSDFPWHNAKKIIAREIKEITSIRGYSLKDRQDFVKNGVFSYDSINDDSFLKKRNYVFEIENSEIELPEGKLFFIDFEILTSIHDDFDSFPIANTKETIFNIGCGTENKKSFKFKSFVCRQLNDEKAMIQEFISFIEKNRQKKVVFVHWTHVEKTSLEKAMKYHSLSIDTNIDIEWFDLCNYFVKNRIFIKDCHSYKLKEVCRALYENKLIKSKWGSTFSDGIGAMTGYIKYLDTREKHILNEIVKYNKIDCKVMWELVKLLKN